jgi:Protein of unknown function (DUF3105)
MPPKPRTGKPKTRTPSAPETGGGRGKLIAIALAVLAGIAVIAVGAALALGGGGDNSGSDVTAALEAAGCTVQTEKAVTDHAHSVAAPNGTSKKWKTFPPTSGPHYAVPAIWGAYTDSLGQAQALHNLEHGGIWIQYGDKVPAATVAELRAFYDDHQDGTLLAPLPQLGDKIAMGAWTTPAPGEYEAGVAHLVKCTAFDQKAYAAFFSAFQFKGPERFPQSSLLPGS